MQFISCFSKKYLNWHYVLAFVVIYNSQKTNFNAFSYTKYFTMRFVRLIMQRREKKHAIFGPLFKRPSCRGSVGRNTYKFIFINSSCNIDTASCFHKSFYSYFWAAALIKSQTHLCFGHLDMKVRIRLWGISSDEGWILSSNLLRFFISAALPAYWWRHAVNCVRRFL